ncbi:MAG: hypothetical protein ACO3JL_01185 [Myxococcota bacterium]
MELNATVFLQLAAFCFLLSWLSAVFFGPMMRVYEERERRIEGSAAEAKQLRDGAETKAGLVDKRLAEAQVEARRILEDLRQRGLEKERELTDAARVQSAMRLEEARGKLHKTADAAREKLHGDAKALSQEIVTKVLGRAA